MYRQVRPVHHAVGDQQTFSDEAWRSSGENSCHSQLRLHGKFARVLPCPVVGERAFSHRLYGHHGALARFGDAP